MAYEVQKCMSCYDTVIITCTTLTLEKGMIINVHRYSQIFMSLSNPFYWGAVLVIKPGTLSLLGKRSTADLNPQLRQCLFHSSKTSLAREKSPSFYSHTSLPYHTLFTSSFFGCTYIFVNKCFQEWSTWRMKLEQNCMTSTWEVLRNYNRFHWSKHRCIYFTKTRSDIPLLSVCYPF